jgi:acetyl esterase
MRTTGTAFAALLGALTVIVLALAGCGPTGDDGEHVTPTIAAVNPELATNPDIPVVENLQYGDADGTPLLLDACLPQHDENPEQSDTVDSDSGQDPAVQAGAARPRPAIIVIHGGSWTRGDKADLAWRAVCQWLASVGYPTFSVDYRLAPAAIFPAAIDDVKAAVRWLREKPQVDRFNLDPDRIGAFGGSAGGNLAALLGTEGDGSQTSGARVAAVVDMSGPADLTGVAVTDDFVPVQLAYLGCATESDCADARAASPVYQVDPTDPPFFIAHSTVEKIPLKQSELLVAQLRDAGIDTDFVKVDGTLHSIAMLDADLKDRIVAFFDAKLAAPAITVTQ